MCFAGSVPCLLGGSECLLASKTLETPAAKKPFNFLTQFPHKYLTRRASVYVCVTPGVHGTCLLENVPEF